MPETEDWTVGRLLQWTADYLKRQASDSPRLDAEILLAQAMGCQRIELYTSYEQIVDENTRGVFRDLVRQRSEGKPVAYLVGRREFYSMSFQVTPDVLIPRPETELLVITLLDLAKKRPPHGPIRIADVGTGSGIIAVCVAKHLPNCHVTAIDISPEALRVAAANVAEHEVADRVELVQGDLLSRLDPSVRFDFIVSNPPYVSTSEMKTLAKDVAQFEPHGALLAGPKGTEVIEKLLPQAADRLESGGTLLIEIGPAIHTAVEELVRADDRWQLDPTIKDLARLPRVIQATRP